MVAQMLLDLTDREEAPLIFRNRFYFKVDQWDGFRSERAQLLADLAGVENMVVLSGDLHGSYAAVLREDFDDPSTPATSVEITPAFTPTMPYSSASATRKMRPTSRA